MPSRYSSLPARTKLKQQVDAAKECKANPVAWERVQDKQKFDKDLKANEQSLTEMTPPVVESDGRAKLRRRMDQLQGAMIKGNRNVCPMPSHRDMWEHVSNAVDRHLQWEKYWKRHTLDVHGNPVEAKNKRGAVWEWKDLARTVGFNEGSEDESPNLANVETFRPEDTRTPLADQRSPRSYGLTPQARENYDSAFPDHEPTPVEKKVAEAIAEEQEKVKDLAVATAIATGDKLRCRVLKKNGKVCGLPCVKGTNACFIRSHREMAVATIPDDAPLGAPVSL